VFALLTLHPRFAPLGGYGLATTTTSCTIRRIELTVDEYDFDGL
jgi:hypothetical protein